MAISVLFPLQLIAINWLVDLALNSTHASNQAFHAVSGNAGVWSHWLSTPRTSGIDPSQALFSEPGTHRVWGPQGLEPHRTPSFRQFFVILLSIVRPIRCICLLINYSNRSIHLMSV